MSVVSTSGSGAPDAGCCSITAVSALISSPTNISATLGSSTLVSAAESVQQNQNAYWYMNE